MDEQQIDRLGPQRASTSRRTLLGSLLVGLPAGLGLAQGAAQARVRVETFSVSFTTESPCTGEDVTVTGVGHRVGGDHFRYELSGVGTSGATYQIFSIDNEGNHGTRRTAVSTLATAFRFVREGGSGDDDFIGHSIVHLTVNANGELTANFVVGESRCA
jgi:hypothetical protein